MSKITYRHDGLQPFRVTVKMDGRAVGTIRRPERDQYYYQPFGSNLRGETFDTLEGVKESLETPAE